MNELAKIFKNPEFGEVRIITDENDEPWFVATDVCKALGYKNSRKALKDNCKDYGVTESYTIDALGRHQPVQIINEANLYRLIIKSRLPKAEPFEKWVVEEVIPSIRKYGVYISKDYGAYTIDEVAKLWTSVRHKKLGRNRAFEILRLTKHLMSNGSHRNVPYQKHIDNGHMLYVTTHKATEFGVKSFNVVLIPEQSVGYIFNVFDKYYYLQCKVPTVRQIKLF